MEATTATPTSPRPYFIPSSIDFASLPNEVRLAFREIVQPAYDELIVAAPGTLERSAGSSLVFLLALEVVDHFALGGLFDLTVATSSERAAEREILIARHLRLIGAKQLVSNFLLRLQQLRPKKDPFIANFRRAGSG